MLPLSRAKLAQRLRRATDQLAKSEAQISAYRNTVPPEPGGFSRAEREKRDEVYSYHMQLADQLRGQIATLRAELESVPASTKEDVSLRTALRQSKQALLGMQRLATGEESHPTWDASFLHYAQQFAAAVKVMRSKAAQINHGHVSIAPPTQPQQ